MNSGATSERAYDALKQRILDGDFEPSKRLEPAELGTTLGISITPVRDALHRLTGEGLIETGTSEGFHMPLMTELGLRGLYAWHGQVLLLAISSWPKTPPDVADLAPAHRALAEGDGPSSLFEVLAARSTNSEHLRALQSCGERLRRARLGESRILALVREELEGLTQLAQHDDRRELRLRITAYHRRRQQSVPNLVRAIYQGR